MTGPSFRFRLERVRAVRERKEKLAQQELARAVSRRSTTEAELRSAEIELAQAHIEQRSACAEPRTMNADELVARQAFLERVEAERRMRAVELEQRDLEVASRDAELAHAASEHEMLNRLRERHRGEHDREVARRERSILDEIASVRFRRSPA